MNRRARIIVFGLVPVVCACLACAMVIALGGLAALAPTSRQSVSPTSGLDLPTSALGSSTRLPGATSTLSRNTPAILTSSVMTPLPLKKDLLASAHPQSLDGAEEEIMSWMRDASGVREVLGTHADEFFLGADAARARAIEALVAKASGDTKPKGMPRPASQGKIIGSVAGFLAIAPDLFGDAKMKPGESMATPGFEYTDSPNEDVQVHLKVQPRIVGAIVSVDVEMELHIKKDGVAYDESASGTVKSIFCPDGQGAVPVEVSLKGAVGALAKGSGGGMQFSIQSSATGWVNDDAELFSIDLESRKEMAHQAAAGAKPGEKNQYVEWTESHRLIGFDQADVGQVSEAKATGAYTRWSSQATQSFAEKSIRSLAQMDLLIVYLILSSAEKKWQNGSCVQIVVPEMEGQSVKSVAAGSETPFTAIVRHKFEGKELLVPVIAALKGKTSVMPSDTKVDSPAAFRYRAPNETGQQGVVSLTTRSRQGADTTDVAFVIGGGYYVDEVIGPHRTTGTLCQGLDKPFVLSYTGADVLEGKYTFTPSSSKGGTWTYSGRIRVGGTGSGSGRYSIQTNANGKAIILDAGSYTVNAAGTSVTGPGNAVTLVLHPTATCP